MSYRNSALENEITRGRSASTTVIRRGGLLCALVACISGPATGQTFDWVKTWDAGDKDGATGIVAAPGGNVLLHGNSLRIHGAGVYWWAQTKLDSLGNTKWGATLAGAGSGANVSRGVGFDASGNTYVGGTTSGTGNASDMTVAKYDASGTLLWQQSVDFGNGTSIDCRDCWVDASGNTYLCGYGFYTSRGHVKTVKFDKDGNLVWQAVWDSPASGQEITLYNPDALVVDSSGNVYLTAAAYTNSFDRNAYLVKYDAAGTFKWASFRNGPDRDRPTSVQLSPDGNIIVAGHAETGSGAYFLTKFNGTTGAVVWDTKLDSAFGIGFMPYIALDKSGSTYMAGQSIATNQYILARYNAAGVKQWETPLSAPVLNPTAVLSDGDSVFVAGLEGTGTTTCAVEKWSSAGLRLWRTYYQDLSGATPILNGLAIDSEGKMVAGGVLQDNSGLNDDFLALRFKLPPKLFTETGTVSSLTFKRNQSDGTGPGHPWQGGDGGVNLYSLAKQTVVPLVGWTLRGGRKLSFSLYHNSMGAVSDLSLGPKWSHSFATFVQVQGTRAAVVEGDHSILLFAKFQGVWKPQDGYHDVLTADGSDMLLTRKDQTQLRFSPTSGNRFRLTTVTDRNGNAVTCTYDSNGRLTLVTDPSGRSLVFGHDGSGSMTSVTFSVGPFSRTWSLAHDGQGRLSRVDYPLVTTDNGPKTYSTSIGYTSTGNNVATLTDKEGGVWRFAYSGDRLATEQWPGNGASQTVAFISDSSTVRRVIDPSGVTTKYEYDAQARLIRVKDAASNATDLSYSDPDDGYQPSQIVGSAGTTSKYDYDANGNVTRYTAPWNATWDASYDAQNDLVELLEPLVTNAFTGIEPSRHRSTYLYDGNGNLTSVQRYESSGSPLVTQFVYDAYGQPLQVIDPRNKATQFVHDGYGNLVSVTTPMQRTRFWTYTDPQATYGYTVPEAHVDGLGGVIGLDRDEWGRLRKRDFPTAPDATFSFDGMDRLVQMQGSSGTTSFTYDANGRTVAIVGPDASAGFTYAPNGLLTQQAETYGNVQRTVTYTYNSRNLLSTVSDGGLSTSFGYDTEGRLIQRNLGNGAWSTFTYSAGRLAAKDQFASNGTDFFGESYGYQENGLTSTVTETGGSLTRYGYDYLGRTVQEERTGTGPYTYQWSYDEGGRRVAQLKDGSLTAYSYDDDGLLSSAEPDGLQPESYTWDANGRLQERIRQDGQERFRLLYDDEGRMSGLDLHDGTSFQPYARYVHDPLGRRVQRDLYVSGQVETHENVHGWFGPAGHVRTDVQGQVSETFSLWAGGLVATRDVSGGGLVYGATDGSGHLRRRTDASGLPDATQTVYNVFGETVASTGSPGVYGFSADQGVRSEGGAGLMVEDSELGAGTYDPLTGAAPNGPAGVVDGADYLAWLTASGSPIEFQTWSFSTGWDGMILAMAQRDMVAPPRHGYTMPTGGTPTGILRPRSLGYTLPAGGSPTGILRPRSLGYTLPAGGTPTGILRPKGYGYTIPSGGTPTGILRPPAYGYTMPTGGTPTGI